MNSWTQATGSLWTRLKTWEKPHPYSQQRYWECLVQGTASLFFADDPVLLVPSDLDLRQETSWFSTKYEACGMRIGTSNPQAMALWQKMGDCDLSCCPKRRHSSISGYWSRVRVKFCLRLQTVAAPAVMWPLYWDILMKREQSLRA